MLKQALLALSLTAGVASAFAANQSENLRVVLQMQVGQTIGLGKCEGTAKAELKDDTIIVTIANNSNCPRIEDAYGRTIPAVNAIKLYHDSRGDNIKFVVRSETGETSAVIFVISNLL